MCLGETQLTLKFDWSKQKSVSNDRTIRFATSLLWHRRFYRCWGNLDVFSFSEHHHHSSVFLWDYGNVQILSIMKQFFNVCTLNLIACYISQEAVNWAKPSIQIIKVFLSLVSNRNHSAVDRILHSFWTVFRLEQCFFNKMWIQIKFASEFCWNDGGQWRVQAEFAVFFNKMIFDAMIRIIIRDFTIVLVRRNSDSGLYLFDSRMIPAD